MLLPHVRGGLTYIYSTICKEGSVQCMEYTLYNEQCITHNSSNLRAQSSTVLDQEEKKRKKQILNMWDMMPCQFLHQMLK